MPVGTVAYLEGDQTWLLKLIDGYKSSSSKQYAEKVRNFLVNGVAPRGFLEKWSAVKPAFDDLLKDTMEILGNEV